MRIFVTLLVVSVLALSCKKEASPEVLGTVITLGGPVPGSVLVQIDNPNSHNYSFVCKDAGTMPPYPQVSCFDHIFVINLPVSLQKPGTRIRFSKYVNKGLNPIFSSTFAPRDVEVHNPTLAQ